MDHANHRAGRERGWHGARITAMLGGSDRAMQRDSDTWGGERETGAGTLWGAMTIVIAGQLLLEDGPRRMNVSPGTIVVREGGSESVSGEVHPSPDFGGPTHLITPGFVDTHVHLPQFDSIGVDGLELLEWLERVIFPAEARWADADFAGAMAARVAKELLSFGTTSVAAYATSHHEGTRAAMEALAAAGMARRLRRPSPDGPQRPGSTWSCPGRGKCSQRARPRSRRLDGSARR